MQKMIDAKNDRCKQRPMQAVTAPKKAAEEVKVRA
jgi:hypothetical protein